MVSTEDHSQNQLIQTYFNEQEFDLITSDPLTYYIVQQVVVAEVKSVAELAAQLSFREDLSARVRPTLERMRRLGMVSLAGESQDEIELLKSDRRYTLRSSVRAQLFPLMFEIGARRAIADCDEGRKHLSCFSVPDDPETRQELDELVLEFKDRMRKIGSRTAGRKAEGVRFVGLINAALVGSDYVRTEAAAESDDESAIYRKNQQAAHDIRPVLAAMHALTEKINTELDPETRFLAQAVLGRLERIAQEFLPASDQEAQPSQDFGLQDLQALVSEKVTQWGDQVELALDTKEFHSITSIQAPTGLDRVISNLLENAKHASLAAGKATDVKLVARLKPSVLEIRVEDQGCGISPEILSQIREGDRVTTKVGGNGLGLSHALHFMKAAGGSLHIESRIGRGTVVTLTLPIG